VRRGRAVEQAVELGVDLLTMYRYVFTLYNQELRTSRVIAPQRGVHAANECCTRLSRSCIKVVFGAMHYLIVCFIAKVERLSSKPAVHVR